ncbi:MAG: class I SAM-dependent methyltransferase [Actinomycetota bacterium]
MIPSPFASIDADDYQRLRRDYPREPIDWFIAEAELAPGSRMLDAGAGTGQATRVLSSAGMNAIAMEPAPNLRQKLHDVVPDGAVVGAKAEALPFRDGSLDAVVSAQSFQWFDGPRAVPELHRVLRPGGALAVVWIESDEGSTLHQEMWEAAGEDPPEGSAIDQAQERWRGSFDRTELFGPFRTATFPFVRRLQSADLPRFIATSSDIAVLPNDRRARALRAVEEWAERLPPEVEIPLLTEVNLSFREG